MKHLNTKLHNFRPPLEFPYLHYVKIRNLYLLPLHKVLSNFWTAIKLLNILIPSKTFRNILVNLSYFGTRFPAASLTSNKESIGVMLFLTSIFPNRPPTVPNWNLGWEMMLWNTMLLHGTAKVRYGTQWLTTLPFTICML